jgi:hypothetical protein
LTKYRLPLVQVSISPKIGFPRVKVTGIFFLLLNLHACADPTIEAATITTNNKVMATENVFLFTFYHLLLVA